MEPSGQMIKLHFSHVSKSFLSPKRPPFQVLGDVSFDVYENEFLVLLGPGQCGKTTLLSMMAGIEPVSSGEIIHGETPVTRPDASRAMVYQTIALFPWLTVEDNVAFGPRARGLPQEKVKKDTQHFIDLVGLTGFEKSYPVQLSGGMKQRVGIARAYCNDPDILLMDEPFGHLDAQTRYMMQESLIKIWESEKRTVVFVTNNLEEAIYLADRILLLSSCPSGIRQIHTIDLPRPRSIVAPEFLALRQQITREMEGNA